MVSWELRAVNVGDHKCLRAYDAAESKKAQHRFKGAETSTALVSFETADKFVNELRMLVKRDAPSAGLSVMIFKAAIDAANSAKALTKDLP